MRIGVDQSSGNVFVFCVSGRSIRRIPWYSRRTRPLFFRVNALPAPQAKSTVTKMMIPQVRLRRIALRISIIALGD